MKLEGSESIPSTEPSKVGKSTLIGEAQRLDPANPNASQALEWENLADSEEDPFLLKSDAPSTAAALAGARKDSWQHRGDIALLDSHTVNQIAAGEVVERPASAVKELIENSLDAGATRITIELEGAGKTLIRIIDDGTGMSAEQAELALQRHATSKIRKVEDLVDVDTLGFRGEALPSIASVARLTIRTAVADGLRACLEVEGGVIRKARPTSGPKGCEVVARDLFYNTPARLKFLKSDSSELGAILDVAGRLAAGRPDVSFKLSHNSKLVFETFGDGETSSALAGVWSRELAQSLVKVDTQVGAMKVVGYVSPPHVTKPNRTYQFVYVNGRGVRGRVITAALDQAYRDLTPERRYPVVALHLELDPSLVDVNVSPTKSEVKFQREGVLFEALRVSIRGALLDAGMMPTADSILTVNEALRSSSQSWVNLGSVDTQWQNSRPVPGEYESPYNWERLRGPDRSLSQDGLVGLAGAPPGEDAGAQPQEFEAGEYAQIAGQPFIGQFANSTPSSLRDLPQPNGALVGSENQPFSDLLDGLRIIGQAMNTFIIAETRKGLAVIDQHVAHERVIYERLCGIKGSHMVDRQRLLEPLALHLDKRCAILIRERLDEIDQAGFSCEPFGGESFLVRTVPAALRGRDPLKILRTLAEEMAEDASARRLAPTREKIWIMASCKMAVKAGDPLSHAEMTKLIQDLAETENPYLCPHGRPITVTLDGAALLRLFKRTS